MSETKHLCPECEQLFDLDELITVYECGSCGETFSQDDSADGISNRCPNDNKFSAKLSDECCPDDLVECEQVEAELSADGEWEVVTPPEPEIKPGHYHYVYISDDGSEEISSGGTYQSEESLREYIEWLQGSLIKLDDGTYKQEGKNYRIGVHRCDEKHKKTRVMPLHPYENVK